MALPFTPLFVPARPVPQPRSLGAGSGEAAPTPTTEPAPAPAAACRAELLAEPSALHPTLWRAQAGRAGPAGGGILPSGFPALDAELPGGGWPVRVLTELLLREPGVGELRLLAPVLVPLARAGRSVMLFDPPAEINAVALAELGWPPAQCLVVRSRTAPPARRNAPPRRGSAASEAGACWALEQTLRSGQAGAVLAWPGAAARPEALRRLQLAAQAHEGPAFLLREMAAQSHPSPAPLRVVLQPGGGDELALQIVKRRGPAMDQPLRLSLSPVLSERAVAKARRLPVVAWRAASPVAVAASRRPFTA
jgi:protein ImuA